MSNNITIPFLDLLAQYETVKNEVAEVICDILSTQRFISGKYVRDFEDKFAAYSGAKHCCGVNSGTSALYLALRAFDIGPGDEVITVPNTFIATAEAISMCGARPVFVDIDETTFNINSNLIEKAISPRTKAIIPVHLYGQCADMDTVNEIARSSGLKVIEDACQAHGAEYRGKKAGSLGDAAAFSFYPGKNLGAFGEAGAIVTNNVDIANKIRLLGDHGSSKKYLHKFIGGNFRMEELQGAVLSVKIKYLDDWNAKRRENAQVYNKLLSGIADLILPSEAYYGIHAYHLYVIRTNRRDELQRHLTENGIGTLIHYPLPIHLQQAYKSLGYKKGDFPVAEKVSNQILSLPMYPGLSRAGIDYVSDMIKEYLTLKS